MVRPAAAAHTCTRRTASRQEEWRVRVWERNAQKSTGSGKQRFRLSGGARNALAGMKRAHRAARPPSWPAVSPKAVAADLARLPDRWCEKPGRYNVFIGKVLQ
jgi:hypothetical protein